MKIHTLYIRKKFTGGLLKGLTYDDKVTGPDMARLAEDWRIGTKVAKPCGGTSPYVIVDASFQCFSR